MIYWLARSLRMTTTLRRLNFILVILVALALQEAIIAQEGKKSAVPDAAIERCINTARETCSKVTTGMIDSIEQTCGKLYLGWACRLGRSYWNAPREKDAEWVYETCQLEAVRQCTASPPNRP